MQQLEMMRHHISNLYTMLDPEVRHLLVGHVMQLHFGLFE
jgi:hypothetical protein